MIYSIFLRVAVASTVSFVWIGSVVAAPANNSREGLRENYERVIAAWDKNHDQRLSRAEWADMLDFWQQKRLQGPAPPSNMADLRSVFMGQFDKADTNHDGAISVDELLREPLATFKCMDTDQDGTISDVEVFDSMQRCASPLPADGKFR